jgi:hypothetical protein
MRTSEMSPSFKSHVSTAGTSTYNGFAVARAGEARGAAGRNGAEAPRPGRRAPALGWRGMAAMALAIAVSAGAGYGVAVVGPLAAVDDGRQAPFEVAEQTAPALRGDAVIPARPTAADPQTDDAAAPGDAPSARLDSATAAAADPAATHAQTSHARSTPRRTANGKHAFARRMDLAFAKAFPEGGRMPADQEPPY